MESETSARAKCGTLKLLRDDNHIITKRKMPMSPRKRSPRNAKSKRGRVGENCPVETGKEYEVDITEISPQGEGIARIKGFPVFVGNAKPGDHLRIKITAPGPVSAGAEIVTST
jgi:predicted RNA-binding protein with TRAM domain